MTELNSICFITGDYPTKNDPTFVFVGELIKSIADLDIKCYVISPQSITRSIFRNKKIRPRYWIDKTNNKKTIEIFQPIYVSFSNTKYFNNLSRFFWQKDVFNIFKNKKIKADVLYGHFWHSGIAASIIGKYYNIPVFIASGESKITVREKFNKNILEDYLKSISGVICVSRKNFNEGLELKLAQEEKMTVIPNSIDDKKFFPIDKIEARNKLGYNSNYFIISFVGAFTERKGILRLCNALQKIEDVKAIYIGSGNQKPFGDNILFCSELPHDQLVYYLNASDVFVLPTLAEGCSNAILEAMACGLPIISSNLSFNDDILDADNSIRVDSNDIDQISNAIKYLKNNRSVRDKMAKASLLKSKNFNIKNRAKKIINFIKDRM